MTARIKTEQFKAGRHSKYKGAPRWKDDPKAYQKWYKARLKREGIPDRKEVNPDEKYAVWFHRAEVFTTGMTQPRICKT